MIELTSVLIIIFLFVFPLPTLVISLGLLTTWSLYKKYEAFHNQPPKGKKNLVLSATLFLVNTICSIFLGIALAFGIFYFIYESFYLFIFNFIFCTSVSLRWFDFTYKLYRLYIFKLKPFKINALTQSYFVVCQGSRERDHGGFGLAPVYADAGLLELDKSEVGFKGVFSDKTFSPSNIINVEKKSSDKIKIHTKKPNLKSPDVFLITLKDQFYPFKSRPDRDKIFHHLSFDTNIPTTL